VVIGELRKFLVAHSSRQFLHSQSQSPVSSAAGQSSNWMAKGDSMDYLVVLMTMLMIAGYACLIGRSLRGTE
jgi:hypothetical protein